MEDGPTNYINYIRCCTETERDNEASIMLFKAAQLYPNNVRLLSLLALCLLDSGKKEEAIAITNKIFKIIDKKSINPETQEECNSLLHAGQYLLSKGDVDKAISYYKKVLQINPKTPMIHIWITVIWKISWSISAKYPEMIFFICFVKWDQKYSRTLPSIPIKRRNISNPRIW